MNTVELKEIEQKVYEIVPEECGLTKVEPEGLDIVLYVRDVAKFFSNEYLVKQLAGAIKKRIKVRVDSSLLADPEEARKKIEQIVPKEANVTDIKFNPYFSEVWIEAEKPGLVIGKKGVTLKTIMIETGWAVKIFRTPTMASSTLKGIRASLFKESKKRKKFLDRLGKSLCKPPKKSEWVKATALGGFKEVGRSCVLVQTPNTNILIDCGINSETFEPSKAYPYLSEMHLEPSDLDAVIVSHAHLDHSGFVPYLYAYGYDGPVYCTPPTRDLTVLLQMDYLNVIARNGVDPPYSIKDIHHQLINTVPVDYNEVVDITPEVKLTLYNSGHILGSAQVHLHIDNGLHNLVYTGDLKYALRKRDMARLFDPATTVFPRVETLFIESTYGGREDYMPPREESEKKLIEIINETVNNGGKVLIPVFSVGRSQEIMLVLEEAAKKNDVKYNVYLDGMILEASAIHTAYPEYLKSSLQKRILSNNSPFESEIFEIVKTDRKEIVEGDPCVILAPSGMLTGGPSVEYLRLMAEDPKNALVFVGYQSVLSLGRKIQRGAKEVPLINPETKKSEMVRINLRVETVEGFSGHADRRQLLSYVSRLSPKPKRIFTMHGDDRKCDELARAIYKKFDIEARALMNLDSVRLR
ncbi:beta-CASP ribonuclease aCPSF1 [Candidatus Micrarchaeota archaeon]|nr:beta-CASP ribonuclease aCPSF1 [Candidatus Micrarchaeota archaeon]